MMPDPLTDLERRILDYLVEYLLDHTYQPSIREIGRRFDIRSTKTVSEYLQSLADKGWIEREASRSRGVRLLGIDLDARGTRIPCYASIACKGGPFDPSARIGDYVIDRRIGGGAGAFFLVMGGEGIAEQGIFPGDMLLAEPVPEREVEDGDLVVARTSGEVVVRKYFRGDGARVLESADGNHAPRLVRGDGFELLGRVIGVYRRLRRPHDDGDGRPAPVPEEAGERAR